MAATTSATAVNASALRRLQRDVAQLQREPIANIVAEPLDGNLFNWAVNMVATEGAWKGVAVHLHLTFPQSYPLAPPTVTLVTDLSGHPNVFGGWICLDMLKDPEYYGKPYQGWSSSYTLSSILTQLCGFLLVDDKIDQMGSRDYSAKRGKLRASAFDAHSCSCKFNKQPALAMPAPEPQPAEATLAAVAAAAAAAAGTNAAEQQQQEPGSAGVQAEAEGSSGLGGALGALGAQVDRLDDHLLRSILAGLGSVELHHCAALGGRIGRQARDLLQRSQLVCFHTKLDYTECLLGYGVSRAWHHDLSTLRGLSAKNDYLSWQAFQEGARKSAWNTSFDAFLPLYLNPEHGKRTLTELPHFTNAIVTPSCRTGRLTAPPGEANPQQLLNVLAMLINSLVVEMVGGVVASAVQTTSRQNPYWDDEAEAKASDHQVTRAMSDAALQAFCHLHHLLLAAALQPGSKIISVARQHVTRFMRDPYQRSKSRCPDLGILLVEYLLVPKEEAPWETFAPIYVREVLARQVRWAIKSEGSWFAQPAREETSKAGDTMDDWKRMKAHFESGKVGLRLVMLQAWFANALARPVRTASAIKELTSIKAAYDSCSGLPPPSLFNAFNQHARSVMQCGSWMQVLAALRLGFSASACAGSSPRALFAAILRQAVVDSFRAGYHRTPTLSLKMAQSEGFLNWLEVKPLGTTSDKWI